MIVLGKGALEMHILLRSVHLCESTMVVVLSLCQAIYSTVNEHLPQRLAPKIMLFCSSLVSAG